ncbi:EKC/KEOPS complex subunit TPRKB-like [Agrilus planipennis]|uniref:EKC/KEOPS complex subunit TPRKB-like n=1 Tax=Agrilus planipennis TaxID=224129 RepID=A0A1W4WZK7_AGRPL|nr:EKC/KEOPS complex subunit TPRKB-like [Agrilus planipennis]
MTYKQVLDPTSHSVIFIKGFKNVKNISELKEKLFDGSLQCCICKLSLILDPFQIVVAANKAITAGKLITKSIYTEILYNLSISKNITQSLQKFGIDESVDNIIVAVIAKENDSVNAQQIFKEIIGDEINLSLLKEMANVTDIRKAYKISDSEFQELPLLESIITRIAINDLI